LIVTAAAQVAAADPVCTAGIELADERIISAAAAGAFRRIGGGREIIRPGIAGHRRAPPRIDGNRQTGIGTRATQECAIGERAAGWIQLGDEGIRTWRRRPAADVQHLARLRGTRCGRKIRRIGRADHICAAGGIDGNAVGDVLIVAPTEIGSIHQRAAGGIQLRNERIQAAGQCGLIRTGCGRKVAGAGESGDIGIATRIDCDAIGALIAGTAAQKGAIAQRQRAAIPDQLGDKCIAITGWRGGQRAGGGRKVLERIRRVAGDIGIAGGIDPTPVALSPLPEVRYVL